MYIKPTTQASCLSVSLSFLQYLFIWRSDDPDDDLGEYFQELLDHLKSPLLHSMEAFLLPDTHDRIRSFREALRSGPGLLVKRDRAKELDFWDWELSRVKDLSAHVVYREKIGLADRARWLTGWQTRGRKALAPSLWPELFDCWNMRRLDMIDCYAASASKYDDSLCSKPRNIRMKSLNFKTTIILRSKKAIIFFLLLHNQCLTKIIPILMMFNFIIDCCDS